jgi:hypothetical protein
MTLVEVVGALALLATVLVALLLGKARYTHQAALAQRRVQAVAAADALLATWHQDPRALPRAGSGAVAGEQQFSWRTLSVSNVQVNEMGAAVVRLEILDDRPEMAGNSIVTAVEFVVDQDKAASPGAAATEKPSGVRPQAAAKTKRSTADPVKKKPNAKSLHNP